jgi:molecular chaperone GrpE
LEQQKSESEAPPKSENPEPSSVEKELAEEKKVTAELSKRLLYLQADILNMQRQSDRRESQVREDVSLKFLLELTSILEDLERAYSAAREQKASPSILDGLKMLVSRVNSVLKSESVERINTGEGNDFDPRVHEAVAFSETTGKDGRILSLVSNGYTYRGKVIKPALVEVARQIPSSAEAPKKGQVRETRSRIEVEATKAENVQSESE